MTPFNSRRYNDEDHRVISSHWPDSDGNIVGGTTSGPGFSIAWQSGPLQDGIATGATIEAVIVAVMHRLQAFQDSPLSNAYNWETLEHLQGALQSQEARTANRRERGVEGSYQA